MIAILFVCLGNICRSPLAEGVFRAQVETAGATDRFSIDSAGCGGWHAGEQPDTRAIQTAARHGIDISAQRARQIQIDDFDRFDLILGLDRDNVRHLTAMRPDTARAKVALYLDEALGLSKNVPDPYYGGLSDFETVYALCEKASAGLLKQLPG
ncbi:low molecular weight protein-tyrosine-phosphatase [Asticcacaulis sp. 201]|uniref:low molecular weight protein-tyrosine-phosphatase n=1 Tax=Asticcacaulis sp. 201 TaxID=3028787 RepID=UPI0029161B01|nr:low molecular weight protein-tyrosine-phosphatase [Asticcacaulis sp. 201]MDV6332377.1 low molecular weight protein-tyrosine-phosphatase [Asticcacaulis sp. 201]